jgi:hypothetical protein
VGKSKILQTQIVVRMYSSSVEDSGWLWARLKVYSISQVSVGILGGCGRDSNLSLYSLI